jgi:molybdopterin molybdotransferase
MLNVKTPKEAYRIICECFMKNEFASEKLPTAEALGRVLHYDIKSIEDVPGFNRSMVDGYAVIAADTFGCTEGMPALLKCIGEVRMGESAGCALTPGECAIVSTGGELPDNADAVVMVEYIEDYGSSMTGILKSVAPGNNVIFKGDDVSVGDMVLHAGTVVTPHDIGILSALGYDKIDIRRKPVVGIISTGDELIETSGVPKSGQIRDVNTPMLLASATRSGAAVMNLGIARDNERAIRSVVQLAVKTCDIVLISGGSSAGVRDMTARVIQSEGELLFHGISMKPGKPTILGVINDKPVFGLPGHPVAAYMVTELFVRPLIAMFMGSKLKRHTTMAIINEAISSNHGRTEYIAVKLDSKGTATPLKSKSGLITSLANADGYICIPGDCEGISKGTQVLVTFFD